MRQKYPYWEWEDYQAGLYGLTWIGTLTDALRLLNTPTELGAAMAAAVERWPKAAAHHLTDGGMNQRAWLGWAACGIAFGVPAHLTRAAWWQLTETGRSAANEAADTIIDTYTQRHEQSLF